MQMIIMKIAFFLCKICFRTHMLLRGVIKNGYFTVRLTVRVNHPPHGQLFVIF